jgi:hypothetical protein
MFYIIEKGVYVLSLKSTLRKLEAANRRAIRDSERRQRELQKRQREYERLEELERARYEVAYFENRIELIHSVHNECSKKWDWNAIKNSPPPKKPSRVDTNEKEARINLETYKPGLLDRLFNRTEQRIKKLEEELGYAKTSDENNHKGKIKQYESELSEWEDLVDTANKILDGDLKTYTEVIEELAPFEDISELGSSLTFKTDDPTQIQIDLHVLSDEVIPNEAKSLTKAGKLSVKNMPKGQYYELYQDYVCSCVIRVAREIFAILPIEKVYIHALGELLNTQTGHIEESPVLSVMIPRITLEKLNFDSIDCSDSMSNFVHNMKFRKTKGFDVVDKISPEHFDQEQATS